MPQIKPIAPTAGKSVAKISFVSLGCPKALVDSERIVTRLRAEGYELARAHAGADLVVVNTCGFLDSAQAESLDAIGAALAENGKVIVTGCMGAQPEKIRDRYPDVLAITGPQQYESVVAAVHAAAPPAHDPFVDLVPPEGIKLTPRHYAYLKISEGCNNRCTFCIIPKLRGDLVSRPAADVLREAERLVAAGVKELLVISQDTSAYGVDLKYAPSRWRERDVPARFLDLARALGELGVWVRLHYVYPYPHVDEVLPLMAAGRILPYLDVPFQHSHPDVLRRMKRPASGEKNLERLQRWRAACPEIVVRSTFIAGFPGETEAEFEHLLDFMREAQIDRAGCFAYSPVEGAAANQLADPVPATLREERRARFMKVAEEVSVAKLQRRVGATMQVLVDSAPALGRKGGVGRSYADAPEIDGTVRLLPPAKASRTFKAGEFTKARIASAQGHDLIGEPI